MSAGVNHGVYTMPFAVDDGAVERALEACRNRAWLQTVREHTTVGEVSVAEFKVHWAEGPKVTMFETVARFGAMVSVRPASPHGIATLLLMAKAYGEPTAWLLDEDAGVSGGRDAAAVWVPRAVGDTAVRMMASSAFASYRWREAPLSRVLEHARAVVGGRDDLGS